MRAKEIIQTLAEGRLEFIRNKYGEKIEEPILNQLMAADPTSRDNQPGNYAEWIIRQYLRAADKVIFIEDLSKVTEDLQTFSKHKHRLSPEQRDINRFSPEQLYDIVKPLKGQAATKTEQAMQGVQKIYQDGHSTVYKLLSHEGSVKIGRGTRWCTAGDSEIGRGHFRNYTASGDLYVFIFSDGSKFQLHVSRETSHYGGAPQFMDSEDRPVDFKTFISKNPEPGFRNFLKSIDAIRLHAARGGFYHEFSDSPIERDPSHVVRSMVAGAKESPRHVIQGLIHDPHPSVRASLARARTEPEIQALLARDKDDEVRRAVADVSANQHILALLAEDPTPGVRANVASNRNTSVELLNQLKDDEDYAVASAVATNGRSTDEILMALGRHWAEQVRNLVIPRLKDKSAFLYKDPVVSVRTNVARHVSDHSVLAELCKDESPEVQFTAMRRLFAEADAKIPDDVAWSAAKSQLSVTRKLVANAPGVNPEILRTLAEDDDNTVRADLAKNPSTPLSALLILAGDYNYWPRKELARRSEPEVLRALQNDPSEKIQKILLDNPATPEDVKHHLKSFGIKKDESLPPEQVNQMIHHSDPNVRASAAAHPGLPPQALELLVSNEISRVQPDRMILIRAGSNPSTPPNVLAKLSSSEDVWIRKAVAANLGASVSLLGELLHDPEDLVKSAAKHTLQQQRSRR